MFRISRAVSAALASLYSGASSDALPLVGFTLRSLPFPAARPSHATARTRPGKTRTAKVKEADVLSFFRKRYTSARNLAFRSPTLHGDGTFHAATNDNESKSNTFPSSGSIEEGTVLIEIRFSGPQPIEGPAGLLCTLLQGTFVGAYPIQLGRGRKRKVRAGVSAGGAAFSFASASSSSSSESRLFYCVISLGDWLPSGTQIIYMQNYALLGKRWIFLHLGRNRAFSADASLIPSGPSLSPPLPYRF